MGVALFLYSDVLHHEVAFEARKGQAMVTRLAAFLRLLLLIFI